MKFGAADDTLYTGDGENLVRGMLAAFRENSGTNLLHYFYGYSVLVSTPLREKMQPISKLHKRTFRLTQNTEELPKIRGYPRMYMKTIASFTLGIGSSFVFDARFAVGAKTCGRPR